MHPNAVKVATGCTMCHKEYKTLQNKYSTKTWPVCHI